MYGTQMQVMCGSSCGPDYGLALAHWAKVELLKEKVKQRMDKRFGPKLDKIADLVVEIALERAKSADELDGKREKLDSAFEELGDEE